MFDTAPDVMASHPEQTIIGDKNYYGREFEHDLTERHLDLLRPARKGEPERAGAHLFKPLRQVIESINQTFKGQLDLERHGGKSPAGVMVRVLCRILALTAAIWHNDKTGQPRADAKSHFSAKSQVGGYAEEVQGCLVGRQGDPALGVRDGTAHGAEVVHGHRSQRRGILRSVAAADARGILAERDIPHVVDLVVCPEHERELA
jgi:hypothetical protein